jgi:hypothetical protein
VVGKEEMIMPDNKVKADIQLHYHTEPFYVDRVKIVCDKLSLRPYARFDIGPVTFYLEVHHVDDLREVANRLLKLADEFELQDVRC